MSTNYRVIGGPGTILEITESSSQFDLHAAVLGPDEDHRATIYIVENLEPVDVINAAMRLLYPVINFDTDYLTDLRRTLCEKAGVPVPAGDVING
jgi:hypothetical protein